MDDWDDEKKFDWKDWAFIVLMIVSLIFAIIAFA